MTEQLSLRRSRPPTTQILLRREVDRDGHLDLDRLAFDDHLDFLTDGIELGSIGMMSVSIGEHRH